MGLSGGGVLLRLLGRSVADAAEADGVEGEAGVLEAGLHAAALIRANGAAFFQGSWCHRPGSRKTSHPTSTTSATNR